MRPTKEYLPVIYRIIETMPLRYFINLREATPIEDMHYATDVVITFSGGAMGVRCREIEFWEMYADLTLRAKCKYNPKTEIHKIREGWCNWYFYGWVTNDVNKIPYWLFLSIDEFRKSGLAMKEKRIIPNKDGTGFHSYSLHELDNAGCILACDMETDKKRGN